MTNYFISDVTSCNLSVEIHYNVQWLFFRIIIHNLKCYISPFFASHWIVTCELNQTKTSGNLMYVVKTIQINLKIPWFFCRAESGLMVKKLTASCVILLKTAQDLLYNALEQDYLAFTETCMKYCFKRFTIFLRFFFLF